jgi:hypothetical protein
MFKIKVKFFILMIASYIFAHIQGGNLPYSIFYGFFLTTLVAFIFIYTHYKLVFIDIKFDKRVYSAGDKDKFTMIVKNNSYLPAPYVFIKNQALSLVNKRYNGDIVNITIDEDKWIKHEINFKTRGVYNFGDIYLSLKDLFCIFESRRKLNRNAVIKVYPKIYEIDRAMLRGSDIFKNAVSNRSSIEDMYSTKDIRKYRDGDNFKRINWKVSAKYNELYVRNFDTVSGQEFNIFLDMNESNYHLDSEGIFEEYMIDFCASLINHMVEKDTKTRLYVNASRTESFSIEGREDFDEIMEFFLSQKSDGQYSFINFLKAHINDISNLSGIGIITAAVDDGLTEYLMNLRDHGHNMVLFYSNDIKSSKGNIELLRKIGVNCYNIISSNRNRVNI